MSQLQASPSAVPALQLAAGVSDPLPSASPQVHHPPAPSAACREVGAVPLHVEMSDHVYAGLAKPLHIQRVERALNVEPLLNYLEDCVAKSPVR